MKPVALTWSEIFTGGHVALRRRLRGLTGNAKPRFGAPDDGFGLDVEWRGVLAEIALASYLGTYWEGLGSVGAIDAGVAEVRSVGDPQHHLTMTDADHDGLPYVSALVTRAALPQVMLRGWVMGADGKHPDHWHEHGKRACYFVPNEKLLPMEQLLVLVGHPSRVA